MNCCSALRITSLLDCSIGRRNWKWIEEIVVSVENISGYCMIWLNGLGVDELSMD
jgi:hypothetical protein